MDELTRISPLATIGYTLLGVSVLNLALAAALLSRQRKDPLRPYAAAMALINALYCCSLGIGYVRASLGLSYGLYQRGSWVGWLIMAPCLQLIFVLGGDRPRARRWGIGLYALWGTVLVLCMLTDLVDRDPVSLIPFVDNVGPLERPLRALGGLNLLYGLYEMHKVHRHSTGRRRQQTAYLFFGMVAYACAAISFLVILPLTRVVHVDPGLVGYFNVAWMVPTTYSIHRRRLLDIRFVLSRTFDALLLAATFTVAELLLLRAASLIDPRPGVTMLTGLGAAFAIFMTALVPRLQRATEHLVAARRYDFQRALKNSAQELAASLRVDDVLRALVHITRDTIGIASGAVLLRAQDRYTIRESFGGAPATGELALDAPLGRWLAEHPHLFIRDEQEWALSPEALAPIDADLNRLSAEAALPISHQGELNAILVLGRKRNKDAYLQIDVDLLETLVAGVGIALANARLFEERERAVSVRDDFLSIAGHELRTPLTALKLNAQMLLSPPPQDPRMRKRLEASERQIDRLERLTKELLDVSQITADKLKLEREQFDLAAVGEETVSRFAEELRRSGSSIELQREGPVIGWWDRARMEQVLSNLLSNAIKYGAGRPISLCIDQGPGCARVRVQDHGSGIDEADQRRIFERFERAVSQDHHGGFGLGLWIAKQVVEAHGGTIAVRSKPDQGSTFLVELPLSGAAA